MSVLLSIILITIVIFWIQKRIWKVEKNIVFPIFTAIFYYWSLAGTWLFTFDSLTSMGKKIGFKYYYLLEKMFSVRLDYVYLQAIWMYGVFIILFQVFTWIGLVQLKKKQYACPESKAIQLTPSIFIFIAIGGLLVSMWIVKEVIFYSLILNESVYINIRTAAIKGYTLHQYACWIMVVSLFIYIGLYLRNDETRFKVKKPTFIFWLVFGICNLYLVLIGSRHETFFGGIVVLMLMSYPYRNIRHAKKSYLLVLSVWVFILMLNDPIRSLMPLIASKTGFTAMIATPKATKEAQFFYQDRTYTLHRSPQKSQEIIAKNARIDTMIVFKKDTIFLKKSEYLNQLHAHSNYLIINHRKIKTQNDHISLVYQNNSFATKIVNAVTNMVFSNELFAGHFSMYGVLYQNVKPHLGLSFRCLFYSFVPSTIVKNRPLDVYTYYAQQMKFKQGQGFTINHITAWYLNFSYAGLILGPLLISLFLLIPFSLLQRSKQNNRYLFSIMTLCGITAFSAMMVRSGPESYKSMLYESVFIPVFILYLASISYQIYSNIRSKWIIKG